jgi:hypothetical protein
MAQDVLLAEHHVTFHDTPSKKMHQLVALTFKTSWIKKEKGQRRWSHRFIFAHKSVLHPSSQCALACMEKNLSFHTINSLSECSCL